METQITINLSNIVIGLFGIIVSVFSFFILRMVKGYDRQTKELYDGREDHETRIAKLETDNEWMKCEIRKQ